MGKNDTFLNHNMGDYRLQEILAVGGMSRVYLGLDQNLGRRAAVKVLELEQTWVDDTIIQRFEREARAIAALEHDNIITIYQYGKHPDGAYFLAMQYIDGRDLRVELKEYSRKSEKMPVERGIRIMQQVASALDFAHKADIIHRDIKPSNVLLTKGDKAILTDFGLVLTATDATLGTAFGTPRYIAPEQAVASQQAVPQSDIYSLAVIMYEILTGGTPFDGETPMEIALAHVSDTPDLPSKREKSVPEAVDKALMKALSKDPAERYQTSVEFVNAVAAGYGIGEQKASSATPVVKSSTSTTARAETSTPRGNVGVPSPVSNTASVPAVKDKRRSPVGVIIGIIVLVLAGAGGYFVLNGGGLPSGGGGSASSDDVVLHYDDKSVVIHNASAEDLSLTRVQFVRGEPGQDGDDYSGDRLSGGGFPNDVLPAGECFRVALTDEEPRRVSACSNGSSQVDEFLSNEALFFWRHEPDNTVSFEVLWGFGANTDLIVQCDTVRNGESSRCGFEYPSEQ